MANLITGTSGQGSFWSRPEGRFGAIVTTALTGLFGWGLYKILPALVSMAHNTLMLGVYVAAIVALFWVTVLDSSLRNMLVNFYKRVIRALYILSFNVDPIGGLRERMKELRERIRLAKSQAGEVKGQSQATQQTIDLNQQVIEGGLRNMQTAKDHGQPERARAESIKVGAAREANQPLLDLKTRLDRSFEQLTRIIEKGELSVDVLDTIVTVKERSFKAAKAGRSAMRAAMEALTGQTDKDDIFKMNLGWVDEYTAQAVGEMDAMLELNSTAINSIDLTQMSYSDDAFRLLEERQSSVERLFANDDRAQRLLSSVPSADLPTTDAESKAAVPASTDFSRAFNRPRK